MKKCGFVFLLLSALFLAACGSTDNSKANSEEIKYENVTVQQAKDLINQEDVVVLDVRTPEEYNEGHIPNATLIPVQELENRLGELDKNTAYLVVCRSGNRSVTASEILVENGFKKVKNMEGGMNRWTDKVEKTN